jgi:dTDP-4-dehydrorhamnose 3,5-epimerase
MRFEPTKIADVWIIDVERREDERGYFARTWCRDELVRQGLDVDVAQCSVSFNARAGTLRGMHYQLAPHAEAKLVSCVRGAIYDVALDLRPGSSTHGQWVAAELNEETLRMLFVPRGCAHGFQTLASGTLVHYQIAGSFSSEHARGVRWNDPVFGIRWPRDVSVMSRRDATYPDFQS